MAFSWDDMRIFLSVARGDSLTAAGRMLGLDPGTVGRRIQRLEASLGQPLFAKSPQGYALTDAGSRLLPHAEAMEQAQLAGSEALTGDPARLTGTVRIGAPDGCANYLLPGVCAAIAAEHPDLDLQIIALPRLVNLTKREADMAIVVSPPDTRRLVVQKLADYHLHLAMHRDRLAAHPVTCLDDLRAHPLIGYIPEMIFDPGLDYLDEAGLGAVQHASNSAAVQVNLLRAGLGVGIVHDFALPTAPDLLRVLPDQVALTRTFYLVRHAEDRRIARLTRLAGLLAQRLRQEIARLEALATAHDGIRT